MSNAPHQGVHRNSIGHVEGQGMDDADFSANVMAPPAFQLMASGGEETGPGADARNEDAEQMSDADWDDAVQMMSWDEAPIQRDETGTTGGSTQSQGNREEEQYKGPKKPKNFHACQRQTFFKYFKHCYFHFVHF